MVVGFSNAADQGFDQAESYGMIIGGVVLLAAAIVNCLYTKRIPIIPPVSRMERLYHKLTRSGCSRYGRPFVSGSLGYSALPGSCLRPSCFHSSVKGYVSAD